MDIFENTDYNIDLDKIKQMIFIYNALNNGWNVKKKKEHYIFSKKHHNHKEIYQDNYLAEFIEKNSNLSKILVNLKKEIN